MLFVHTRNVSRAVRLLRIHRSFPAYTHSPVLHQTPQSQICQCKACSHNCRIQEYVQDKKWTPISIRSCIKIGVHCGRGTKTRTQDTWFWRPLLYQLSYTPVERIYYTTSVLELQYLFSKKSVFLQIFLILQCIIAFSPGKSVDERVNLRGTATRFFPFPLPFCECAAAPIPSGDPPR